MIVKKLILNKQGWKKAREILGAKINSPLRAVIYAKLEIQERFSNPEDE